MPVIGNDNLSRDDFLFNVIDTQVRYYNSHIATLDSVVHEVSANATKLPRQFNSQLYVSLNALEKQRALFFLEIDAFADSLQSKDARLAERLRACKSNLLESETQKNTIN